MNDQSLYYKTVLAMVTFLVVMTSCTKDNTNDITGTTKVALREAGHQLLLRKLDSTSLVLPVKEFRTLYLQLII